MTIIGCNSKVLTQLPLGDENGIHELLDLEVAGLGIGQDLANEVHRALHIECVCLFFLLYHQGSADHLHGGRDVEQKLFPAGQRDQDRGLRQKPLDHVKCLLGLRHPFKAVGLL